MQQKYILALDQGTGSSRAILFDKNRKVINISQCETKQYFPQDGWVEQDPVEIWNNQLNAAKEVMHCSKVQANEIASIGVTNQRETTVVWDKHTGTPVYPAIIWQDQRTAADCKALIQHGHKELIRSLTGLMPDAYFSASKIAWILNNVEGAMDRALRGDLLFGTIDSWLVWNLSGKKLHITDASNASRTMLYNIVDGAWDEELMNIMGIPSSMLPLVVNSSEMMGVTAAPIFGGTEIPIGGIAGDQQAALYGQSCFSAGMAKNTYGTGCFMLMQTGQKAVFSDSGLLTTIAWKIDGITSYALEGSVFHAGSAIKWLRDQLKIIPDTAAATALCEQSGAIPGLYMVPAFNGLGAPYWDMDAKALFTGFGLNTGKPQFVRAVVESIAYQSCDVLQAMASDSGLPLKELRVDGGATVNDFLMQFQADLLGVPVVRPSMIEATALGAAMLAGRSCGFWSDDTEEAKGQEKIFFPEMPTEQRDSFYNGWKAAIKQARYNGQ